VQPCVRIPARVPCPRVVTSRSTRARPELVA
jgi:hypothetical protein